MLEKQILQINYKLLPTGPIQFNSYIRFDATEAFHKDTRDSRESYKPLQSHLSPPAMEVLFQLEKEQSAQAVK